MDIVVARLRSELEQAHNNSKRAEVSLTDSLSLASSKLQEREQELEGVQAELNERTVQVSVLTDTVEALQVGNTGEREQRMVNLTAQLVTGRMKEAALERRAAKLANLSAEDKKRASNAEAARDSARAESKVAAAAAASWRQQQDRSAAEVAELRKEVRQLKSAKQALIEECDKATRLRMSVESEVAGLQEAMQQATARHFEQLGKERATARAVPEQRVNGDWDVGTGVPGGPCEPEYVGRLREQLSQLLTTMEQHVDEHGALT
jgi:chromosome segregation ATPase